MAESSSFGDKAQDAFKDRLSRRARDTTRPALAHQSRGRPLSGDEQALADALMEIMGAGEKDFAAVAHTLARRGVRAPISGRTNWDAGLLEEELRALNAEFDTAYARAGYGA
ncbi:MAG: recombinase-like helix-turn-helix domain-containing protein [Rhizobiaceae bacterium]